MQATRSSRSGPRTLASLFRSSARIVTTDDYPLALESAAETRAGTLSGHDDDEVNEPGEEGKASGDFVWEEGESEALWLALMDAELTASAESVRAFLRQIDDKASLSAEEEVALAKRIEAGRQAAMALTELAELGDESTDAHRRDLMRICRDGLRTSRFASSQSAGCSVAGQALRRPRRGLLGPPASRQRGPPLRGREVRLHKGLQVLNFRHVVDPAGDHPLSREGCSLIHQMKTQHCTGNGANPRQLRR
jgi:Sigma-70 factor, region 1.2